MQTPRTSARYLRFNAVGVLGFALQLALVAILTAGAGAPAMLATAIGVEAAVLHNFFWHERWTWADRGGPGRGVRLTRFHLANGLISIVGNVAFVGVLTGATSLAPVPANIVAVVVCSVVNFLAGDRLVFHPASGTRPPAPPTQSLPAARSSPTYP